MSRLLTENNVVSGIYYDVYSTVLSRLFCLCSGEEAFYPTSNTLGVGEHKDSEEGINHMVEDLEKQYVPCAVFIAVHF